VGGRASDRLGLHRARDLAEREEHKLLLTQILFCSRQHYIQQVTSEKMQEMSV